MSMLYSIANAISSGCWPILFQVLTLNVVIYIVLSHSSNFCLCLSSTADFSNAPFVYPHKGQGGLDAWFE